MVINEVVAAELGAHFAIQTEMERFLKSVGIALTPTSLIAAHDAGQRWRVYLRTRKGARERVVADFFVASHALHQSDRLLTRDPGFYRTYFSELLLL